MYTRREFGKLTLAGLALPRLVAAADPVNGVRLGVQTYSFRDLPRPETGDAVDVVIKAMTECGITDCELFAPQVEPRFSTGPRGGGPGGRGGGRRGDPPSPEAVKAREDLRKWRLETPLDHFRDVGRKFKTAGITVYAYNYSANASFTDAEIDRGFEMANAMGVKVITASSTISAAKKVAPFADKHKIQVAMHGHDNLTDPEQFAKPESFAAALEMSKYFMINLDIGHFVSAGYDPVEYIKQHHDRIVVLHVKDRTKAHGNFPFGQGETPIKQVLLLLQTSKWTIPANIEYEYKGEDAIAEVKKCYQFMKEALA
jgi:sugar phosphate isomerase/epimerase